MKKEFSLEKNFRVWSRSEVTWSLSRLWEWWATWEGEWGWFPRWQDHRTTPKRKTEQKPNKSKEKEKGQKPGCYNPSPLKEITSSRFGCSGNKYDFRTPFWTQVSFFLYLLFPQEFQMIVAPRLRENRNASYSILEIEEKSSGIRHCLAYNKPAFYYYTNMNTRSPILQWITLVRRHYAILSCSMQAAEQHDAAEEL